MFGIRDDGEGFGLIRICDHYGERFVDSSFALTESTNRIDVGRAAGQMKTTDTLHRNDLALTNRAGKCINGLRVSVITARRAMR